MTFWFHFFLSMLGILEAENLLAELYQKSGFASDLIQGSQTSHNQEELRCNISSNEIKHRFTFLYNVHCIYWPFECMKQNTVLYQIFYSPCCAVSH